MGSLCETASVQFFFVSCPAPASIPATRRLTVKQIDIYGVYRQQTDARKCLCFFSHSRIRDHSLSRKNARVHGIASQDTVWFSKVNDYKNQYKNTYGSKALRHFGQRRPCPKNRQKTDKESYCSYKCVYAQSSKNLCSFFHAKKSAPKLPTMAMSTQASPAAHR